jgi:SH3-like domain-containing protein
MKARRSVFPLSVIRPLAGVGLCAAVAALFAFDWPVGPAQAQGRDQPYWAAIQYDEVNMRVGPSKEYPIDWVYTRKGLPVQVVRVREGWRLIRDHEGTQGWVAESQLERERQALVIGEGIVDLRASPDAGSALNWRAEPGVVGALVRCRSNWCEIDVGGRAGWVEAARLWGAGEL